MQVNNVKISDASGQEIAVFGDAETLRKLTVILARLLANVDALKTSIQDLQMQIADLEG